MKFDISKAVVVRPMRETEIAAWADGNQTDCTFIDGKTGVSVQLTGYQQESEFYAFVTVRDKGEVVAAFEFSGELRAFVKVQSKKLFDAFVHTMSATLSKPGFINDVRELVKGVAQ